MLFLLSLFRLAIAALCLITLNAFRTAPSRAVPFRYGKSALQANIDDIRNDIQKYLIARNASVQVPLNEAQKASIANPVFAFYQPSGWFKDEYKIDLDKRSDRRVPITSHPLSYIELKKYGYEYLSEAILSLGGPHIVGREVGIDWDALVEKFKEDELAVSIRTDTYALDTRGSLSLGQSLDDKLSMAADLELNAVRGELRLEDNPEDTWIADRVAAMASKNTGGAGEGDSDDFFANYERKLGESYGVSERVSLIRKSTATQANANTSQDYKGRDDRFSLASQQRLYFLLWAMVTAGAFGRASSDLLLSSGSVSDDSVVAVLIHAMESLSSAMTVASAGSCAYSGIAATKHQRNLVVWALKGLLGGPFTVLEIRRVIQAKDS